MCDQTSSKTANVCSLKSKVSKVALYVIVWLDNELIISTDVYAYRSPASGSYFITYIVDVFTTSTHTYDIMELFRRVILFQSLCFTPAKSQNNLFHFNSPHVRCSVQMNSFLLVTSKLQVSSRMENDPRFTCEMQLLPCIERTTLVRKLYLFPGL